MTPAISWVRSLPMRVVVTRMPLLHLGAAACAGLLAGPVAGVATGVYATVAARTIRRWRADRAAAIARTEALDALGALAADLRAGLPAPLAFDRPRALAPLVAVPRLHRLVSALRRLAEETGAPLADLMERLEADWRAGDRSRAAAAAEAAGARATGWLLAGLPAAGMALGYAMGADPLHVLLHTPIGAACAGGAMALQVTGLAWAERLAREPA
ncbi:hypothetical protein [Rhizomonospora bruguierae]|uniref:hypothetical protein n=1 Tax=Rhizomonospora bruguierae TaxID=1581705 RepID=UPI0020BEFB25|nr:hypothetical protein [Micromonospora sp. NBRC 107566]